MRKTCLTDTSGRKGVGEGKQSKSLNNIFCFLDQQMTWKQESSASLLSTKCSKTEPRVSPTLKSNLCSDGHSSDILRTQERLDSRQIFPMRIMRQGCSPRREEQDNGERIWEPEAQKSDSCIPEHWP